MEFEYITADPTGNITVLISTPYTAENRKDMISAAFELVPDCEQAGFIMSESDDSVSIEMMGYEFCGNATLSASSLRAYRNGAAVGEECVIRTNSSGIDETLDVRVRRLEDRRCSDGKLHPVFEGTVRMPEPELSTYKGWPLVQTDGISHLLIPDEDMSDDEAAELIKAVADELKVAALGIMLYSVSADAAVSMRPLVYVPASETLVWEHGCATGSTALGYWLDSLDEGNNVIEIHQPGGTMYIRITDGRPFMTGQVTLMI